MKKLILYLDIDATLEIKINKDITAEMIYELEKGLNDTFHVAVKILDWKVVEVNDEPFRFT